MAYPEDFPYPSSRMPVYARNAVATSQPLASSAGIEMMRRGGNAVDAALAAAITLTVVEPTSNGIGSDLFALVWDDGQLHGLNSSGRSPAAWTPERFAGRDTMPLRGWDSVTVPGAVAGWKELSVRFGRLPFEKLFEPAVRHAGEGFLVSPVTAVSWAVAATELHDGPGFAEAFLPQGRAPQTGELFRCEDQARTLRVIAESGGTAFYRGHLAQRIADHAHSHGGVMTADDLAAHRADWVTPISQSFHGVDLHEIPPNGQGVAALIALGIAAHLDLAASGPDTADSIHLQVEAMKVGFLAARSQVADPDSMTLDIGAMLDPGYLTERAAEIDPRRARPLSAGHALERGTVYLTTADEGGTMVSLIQSNYLGFGSGVVVPGTGISLQNRGYGFSLEPGHPNQVAGSKRPYHTIIPAFVTRNGDADMSFGVMGAHMQPQGHLQMMVRMYLHGQNPQAASDAPRWQISEDLSTLELEPGMDPGVVEQLRERGHRIEIGEPGHLFGGAQLIRRQGPGYCAASDHRKDGQAQGF